MVEATTHRPIRVVVVDDEPDIRTMVKMVLSRKGAFEVVGEASDGADAIDVIADVRPDVVLLDLMMPTPGDESLPHILSASPTSMVAVFSASDPSEHRQRLLGLGAFAFYEKATLQDLARRLEADYDRFARAIDGEDTLPTWLLGDRSG